MNVLFHIAVGASIIANSTSKEINSENEKFSYAVVGFTFGVLSHGILDYIPHCYPVNSKIDVLSSLSFILIAVWSSNKKWKPMVAFTLLGCILPDVIDLSPGIMNSLLGLDLPTFENLFPWHRHEYSGSIYSDDCEVSTINHFLTIFFCGLIIWINRKKVGEIFKDNKA